MVTFLKTHQKNRDRIYLTILRNSEDLHITPMVLLNNKKTEQE